MAGVFDPYIHAGLGMSHSSTQRAYHQAQNQASLQNAQAYQSALQGLAQYQPFLAQSDEPSNVTPMTPRGHRTQEQIEAELAERYRQLELEAARLRAFDAMHKCRDCRWADKFQAAWCHQPLVKGFGEKFHMGMDKNGLERKIIPRLCGIEKALWEPKRNIWQRFIDWFLQPWKDVG